LRPILPGSTPPRDGPCKTIRATQNRPLPEGFLKRRPPQDPASSAPTGTGNQWDLPRAGYGGFVAVFTLDRRGESAISRKFRESSFDRRMAQQGHSNTEAGEFEACFRAIGGPARARKHDSTFLDRPPISSRAFAPPLANRCRGRHRSMRFSLRLLIEGRAGRAPNPLRLRPIEMKLARSPVTRRARPRRHTMQKKSPSGSEETSSLKRWDWRARDGPVAGLVDSRHASASAFRSGARPPQSPSASPIIDDDRGRTAAAGALISQKTLKAGQLDRNSLAGQIRDKQLRIDLIGQWCGVKLRISHARPWLRSIFRRHRRIGLAAIGVWVPDGRPVNRHAPYTGFSRAGGVRSRWGPFDRPSIYYSGLFARPRCSLHRTRGIDEGGVGDSRIVHLRLKFDQGGRAPLRFSRGETKPG